MDKIDRAILNRLQYGFPLTIRPFSTIAGSLGLTSDEVLERIAELKRSDIVRQISAIFDSSKIGYQSVLVAFKVPLQKLEAVAQELNANPGVSHNYVRTNDFNLWFTLTIPKTADLKKEAA
ncbi:MAG: Lrp/AsnC family transcriptional regulator, partial [Chitinivibrionales bacterium]|nr:Lrp/AsnC family transcriptional regulator [Chitinivibrionales bacterium]